MKILILTYYYPPCNSIASLRPYSWAKKWSELNHDITVVTRNWSSEDNNWEDFLNSSKTKELNIQNFKNYKLIQLPYKKKKYPSNKYIRKIQTLKNILTGNFNNEYDAERFRAPCENEIIESKPDCIIVTSPPINLIKLGYELSQKHTIRFVADFRDYENFSTLKTAPSNSIYRKIDIYIKNKYLTKWLSNTLTVSVASEEFAVYFDKMKITKKAKEYTNGFEGDVFSNINVNEEEDKFSIAILGTILPNQDSSCFLNGFNLFLDENPNARVKIDFVGGQAIEEVAKIWSENIPPSILNITPRIGRTLALTIGKKANVLFYPGWEGYKGMYSGIKSENFAMRYLSQNTLDNLHRNF